MNRGEWCNVQCHAYDGMRDEPCKLLRLFERFVTGARGNARPVVDPPKVNFK